MLIRVSTCIAVVFAISTQVAEAKTAAEAAAGIAKKRGYTAAQTKCYVETFPQYAHQNPQGGWDGPAGKAAAPYKSVLFSKCGIQR